MNFLTSPFIFAAISAFSLITIQAANANMIVPWPASPNITANKNGKVVVVYNAVEMQNHFTVMLKSRIFCINFHSMRCTDPLNLFSTYL